MYFDFDDYRPDIYPVGRAISWREGILISIILHMGLAIFILLAPRLLPARAVEAQPVAVARATPEESPRFVFMQPRVDTPAPAPPPQAPASDQDRLAQAPERAERPTNPLPFARGNSPERIEAPPPSPPAAAAGQGAQSQPPAGQPDGQVAENRTQEPPIGSEAPGGLRLPPEFTRGLNGGAPLVGGRLGDALQNLQQYIEQQSFDNPTGGARPGASIQFDSKGVDFGPWLRRFVAQIRRNWFIPYAVMTAKGHTVVTFYVHRDGSITDLQVPGPSAVDAFNTAAVGALSSSNPTQPLPTEYPDDRVLFTVTFYYNEQAPE